MNLRCQRYLLFALLAVCSFSVQAQDSIRVLIIYGSEPARHAAGEYKWFGGRAGGHVAIQVGDDSVLSFHPTVYHPCHVFPRHRSKNFRSRFDLQTVKDTWWTFDYYCKCCYDVDALQRMVVTIPVSRAQRDALNRIVRAYLAQPPYDYAVLGMRCASASYEILAQLGLFDKPFKHGIWWKILYPRDLRYQLRHEAKYGKAGRHWSLRFYPGSRSRIWDWDKQVN